MKLFRYVFRALVCILLTVITQVGGIVYLINFLGYRYLTQKIAHKGLLLLSKITSFLILYLVFSFLVVPPLASLLGRVPLPMQHDGHLRPLNVLTFLLNRHYVRPELKTLALQAAETFQQQYPGSQVNYLDANFPFLDGFPLVPHLSHNDGRKLDLAFCYIDKASGLPINQAPSFLGYGICEESRTGEVNTAAFCAQKGYWQYSFLRKIMPQTAKTQFDFDARRTKALVDILSAQKQIAKIFIEPHLADRLKLNRSKIRFHGCRAVRHDDHIHIQVK